MPGSGSSVEVPLGHWPAQEGDINSLEPRIYDMRTPEAYAPVGISQVMTSIHDARAEPTKLGLETGGFELFEQPSRISDWFDTDEVMSNYYEECKSLARRLTSAPIVTQWNPTTSLSPSAASRKKSLMQRRVRFACRGKVNRSISRSWSSGS